MDLVAVEPVVVVLSGITLVMIGLLWIGSLKLSATQRQVDQLEQQFQTLAKRFHQRTNAVSTVPLEQTAYQRAQAMLSKNEPIEKIVTSCNISLAEAELLKLMYAQVQNTPDQDRD